MSDSSSQFHDEDIMQEIIEGMNVSPSHNLQIANETVQS